MQAGSQNAAVCDELRRMRDRRSEVGGREAPQRKGMAETPGATPSSGGRRRSARSPPQCSRRRRSTLNVFAGGNLRGLLRGSSKQLVVDASPLGSTSGSRAKTSSGPISLQKQAARSRSAGMRQSTRQSTRQLLRVGRRADRLYREINAVERSLSRFVQGPPDGLLSNPLRGCSLSLFTFCCCVLNTQKTCSYFVVPIISHVHRDHISLVGPNPLGPGACTHGHATEHAALPHRARPPGARRRCRARGGSSQDERQGGVEDDGRTSSAGRLHVSNPLADVDRRVQIALERGCVGGDHQQAMCEAVGLVGPRERLARLGEAELTAPAAQNEAWMPGRPLNLAMVAISGSYSAETASLKSTVCCILPATSSATVKPLGAHAGRRRKA